MRDRFGRAGAVTGLLAALFNDLSRRAWWAYRSSHPAQTPRTTIVARRPTERHQHVPTVTPAWQLLVERALPVHAWAATRSAEDELLPVVWIDVAERLDIVDLPRVLSTSGDEPVLATQWLFDATASAVVLVVTFVEPVTCSWALRLVWPQARTLLELVLSSGDLVVALGQPPAPLTQSSGLPLVAQPTPRASIRLPIHSLIQLNAILDADNAVR